MTAQDSRPASLSKADMAVDAPTRALLAPEDRALLAKLETSFAFSFQQLRLFARWSLDCAAWGETEFRTQALSLAAGEGDSGNARQKGGLIFQSLQAAYDALAAKAKAYPAESPKEVLPAHRFEEKELKGRIFRLCPAASEKAVCCNLKVLN